MNRYIYSYSRMTRTLVRTERWLESNNARVKQNIPCYNLIAVIMYKNLNCIK